MGSTIVWFVMSVQTGWCYQLVYPEAEGHVVGIRCRALLDVRAGSSNVLAALISKLNRNPHWREYKTIETMNTWTSQKIEMYKFQVSDIKVGISLPTIPSKVEKGILLTIKNLVWISSGSTNTSRAWKLMILTSSPRCLYTWSSGLASMPSLRQIWHQGLESRRTNRRIHSSWLDHNVP